MGARNPAVDAYMAKAAPFARPILKKLRTLFHRACPAIEEKIKWGVPSFERLGMVGGMAAFQRHVSFGFWKGSLLRDPRGYFRNGGAMTGAKIAKLSDLPPDAAILDFIRQAVVLNEKGVKLPRSAKKDRKALPVPSDFSAALAKNAKARATFEGFSPSNRREYLEWVSEAKREETRTQRLATAIAWMARGKPRNWKYMNGSKGK